MYVLIHSLSLRQGPRVREQRVGQGGVELPHRTTLAIGDVPAQGLLERIGQLEVHPLGARVVHIDVVVSQVRLRVP